MNPSLLTHRHDGEGSSELPLTVHVLLFDGVEEMDFVGPHEVFSVAGAIRPGTVGVHYVTAGEPGVVTTGVGTRLEVAYGWSPADADVLVVPGSGPTGPTRPGVEREMRMGVIPGLLREARREGLLVTSVCTGALLLGAAGLLEARPSTTHAMGKNELAGLGGIVQDARVVDAGDVVTSAGITSGLDLGLHLVRRLLGAETATRVETVLEYEARGPLLVVDDEPRRVLSVGTPD